jgi:hypothetical protein
MRISAWQHRAHNGVASEDADTADGPAQSRPVSFDVI